MKLACASASLHREIDGGDLTQLEFIDLCARELPCDGVILDVRHFPRTDEQYLAQIKKMAADTGLTIAALQDDRFMSRDEAEMTTTFAMAVAIGAPLLAIELSPATAHAWVEEVERLSAATGAAKAANVTLAVRNVADTFCATAADIKRTLKESDSAWARLALEYGTIDDPDALGKMLERYVLLWSAAGEPWPPGAATFRGFAALSGTHDAASIGAALGSLRTAIRATES